MPKKPNYNFAKRQKEVAKAKRKADKRARKQQKDDDPAAPLEVKDATSAPE